jgi:phosphoribosyl-ATP pyrophosphohydrolase
MSDFLYPLQDIIRVRKALPQSGSYTSSLFEAGLPRISQKVGEEAVEVVVAALSQQRAEQIGEISDLIYHTLVLLAALDLTLDDISAELERRHAR